MAAQPDQITLVVLIGGDDHFRGQHGLAQAKPGQGQGQQRRFTRGRQRILA